MVWNSGVPASPAEILRDALDTLPMAIAVLSPGGVILAVNAAWLAFPPPFGTKSAPPAVNDSYLDFCDLAAAHGNSAAADIVAALYEARNGGDVDLVLRYTCGTGLDVRWIRTSMSSSGRGVLVLRHIDVTKEMLRAQKLGFQASLLKAVGQSVIAVQLDGKVIYWNDASERMLGWTAEEVVGKHFIDLGLIENSDDAVAIVRRVKAGKAWSGEHWTQHRNGRRFSVYSTITPLRNDEGEVVAIIDVSTDTTEIRRAEAETQRLSALVESSSDAINGATLAGVITSWNSGAEKMYGYSAAEVIGHNVSMLSPHADDAANIALRNRLLSGKAMVSQAVRGVRKDGSTLDVSLTFSPVYDGQGKLAGSSAIARDVTEVTRLRAAMELERDRLVAAQEMAHVGSVEVDMVTGRRWWSDEYFRIHGLSLDSAPTEELWLSAIHPEDRQLVERLWRELESGGPPLEAIHRIIRPTGEVRWVLTRATAEHDDAGVLLRLVETTVDITDRKVAEEALEALAFKDPLTGLANRARLTESIEGALARAADGGDGVGVLFLDVDRFKVINDAMGHAAGDALLVQLAERLRRTVRPEDVVARFAGDEFVIVCSDISEEGCRRLANRIQQAVRKPFTLLDREIFATISVGIATSAVNDTAESLLHNADAAMYRSKEGSQSAPVVFHGSMHAPAHARLDIESQLPRVIERGELRIHYQPIVDVRSGRPVGMEALVRWQHPQHGLIAPNDFIPVAEETGMIVPIGAWVLAEALQQVQRWRTDIPAAENWRISVNISARQLQDPDLFSMVEQCIADAGIAPEAVELEITESVLMEDADSSLRTLTKLRTLGIGLSIDDFGTGYSSLGYLKRFPVTALKIDRSFVDGLGGTDVHADSIVQAITGLAKALNLNVVAEGVETQVQFDQLARLHAGLAQGFLWAKPLPPEEIVGWLASHELIDVVSGGVVPAQASSC